MGSEKKEKASTTAISLSFKDNAQKQQELGRSGGQLHLKKDDK